MEQIQKNADLLGKIVTRQKLENPTVVVEESQLPAILTELLDREEGIRLKIERSEIENGYSTSRLSSSFANRPTEVMAESNRSFMPVTSSTSVDGITTPQQELTPSFFTINERLQSIIPLLPEQDESVTENVTYGIQEKLFLNEDQAVIMHDLTGSDITRFLNEAVIKMEPVHDDFLSELTSVAPYLFSSANLTITVTTVLSILNVTVLTQLLTVLTSGDISSQVANLKAFLIYFKPLLIPFTNVLVWARYTFLGFNSIRSWVLACLNQTVHKMNILSNSIGRYTWADQLVYLENTRSFLIYKIENLKLFVVQNSNLFYKMLMGASLTSLLVSLGYWIFKNPTQLFAAVKNFLLEMHIYFPDGQILEYFKRVLTPVLVSIFLKSIKKKITETYFWVTSDFDITAFEERLKAILVFMADNFYL